MLEFLVPRLLGLGVGSLCTLITATKCSPEVIVNDPSALLSVWNVVVSVHIIEEKNYILRVACLFLLHVRANAGYIRVGF
jgi:hypothetical protein